MHPSSPSTQTTISSIRYEVPSRRRNGKVHTVSLDPRDNAIISCSCEAGQYGKSCWHRVWVADGKAGKPRIRVTIATTTPPTTPCASAARRSGNGASLDV